ncbi:MAG: hypothetical protein V7640_2838 [Betaproteobacteria bacterium]|jgi:hypothetical protein
MRLAPAGTPCNGGEGFATAAASRLTELGYPDVKRLEGGPGI